MLEIFTLSLGFSRMIFEESFVATIFFCLSVFLIIVAILMYYMAPSIIAYRRAHKNFKVILLLNLFSIFLLPLFFGGLTFLAWFLCFVFAWTNNVETIDDLRGNISLFKVLIFMIFIFPTLIVVSTIFMGIGIPYLIIAIGKPYGDYLGYFLIFCMIFGVLLEKIVEQIEKLGIVLAKIIWKIIKWGLPLLLLIGLFVLGYEHVINFDYKQFKMDLIESAIDIINDINIKIKTE